ncbi:hypothetical protein ABT274_12505 [Streptomyces sp. NPDC001127]|uniref:hypothetical protein n=1 Tax=Streptomyces sp. NPDC001127 TaxID=3154377 RepID=UPI00331CE144
MALSCALASAKPQLVQSLVNAIEDAPITETPIHLLVSVGAMVCKIAAIGITYYHLVVSDQATDDCEKDVDATFQEEGVKHWRDAAIEIVHMSHPNMFFPSSTKSTLYVIHPEVAR